MNAKDLARLVKQRRLSTETTQTELAIRAGIEQSLVSKIERGLDVRLSTLNKILNALDLVLEISEKKRLGQSRSEKPFLEADVRARQSDQPKEQGRSDSLLQRFQILDDDDEASTTRTEKRHKK